MSKISFLDANPQPQGNQPFDKKSGNDVANLVEDLMRENNEVRKQQEPNTQDNFHVKNIIENGQ